VSTEMAKRGGGPLSLDRLQAAAVAVEPDIARAVAEVQGAMMIAKRFPRDEKGAIDRIKNACTRESLAKRALYTYARGGQDITGPSIRMAECIAMNWGNLQYGLREIEQRDGESTVEAFAFDLETNTRSTKLFQVSHIRATKAGRVKLTDPRDIYELVANQGARRVRACILSVIPGDVVEEAVEQVHLTLSTKEALSPEKIKAMVDAFAELGVTKEMIEAKIQRRLEAITPAQVVNLRAIFTSIEDGMRKPEEWFEFPAKEAPPASTKPATAAQQAKAEAEKREAPADSAGMSVIALIDEIGATVAKLPEAKESAFRRQMKKSLGIDKIEDEADIEKLQKCLGFARDWADAEGA